MMYNHRIDELHAIMGIDDLEITYDEVRNAKSFVSIFLSDKEKVALLDIDKCPETCSYLFKNERDEFWLCPVDEVKVVDRDTYGNYTILIADKYFITVHIDLRLVSHSSIGDEMGLCVTGCYDKEKGEVIKDMYPITYPHQVEEIKRRTSLYFELPKITYSKILCETKEGSLVLEYNGYYEELYPNGKSRLLLNAIDFRGNLIYNNPEGGIGYIPSSERRDIDVDHILLNHNYLIGTDSNKESVFVINRRNDKWFLMHENECNEGLYSIKDIDFNVYKMHPVYVDWVGKTLTEIYHGN